MEYRSIYARVVDLEQNLAKLTAAFNDFLADIATTANEAGCQPETTGNPAFDENKESVILSCMHLQGLVKNKK